MWWKNLFPALPADSFLIVIFATCKIRVAGSESYRPCVPAMKVNIKTEMSMISNNIKETVRHLAESSPNPGAPRVLFVCLGNICRSSAAQGVLEDMAEKRGIAVAADSAGTYGGHSGQLPDPRMRSHAARRGYSLTHRARQIKRSDFDNFDIIVAMDNSNFADVRSMAPTSAAKGKVVKMIDFCSRFSGYNTVPDIPTTRVPRALSWCWICLRMAAASFLTYWLRNQALKITLLKN